jgi:Ca2+/Na+ antiporter
MNKDHIKKIPRMDFIYTENPRAYLQLEAFYFQMLFVSGLLFLGHLGALSWWSGIGWFFFSIFMSVFITRSDYKKNQKEDPMYEFKNSMFTNAWMN